MSSDGDVVDLVGIEMDYLEKDEDPTGPYYQLQPRRRRMWRERLTRIDSRAF